MVPIYLEVLYHQCERLACFWVDSEVWEFTLALWISKSDFSFSEVSWGPKSVDPDHEEMRDSFNWTKLLFNRTFGSLVKSMSVPEKMTVHYLA